MLQKESKLKGDCQSPVGCPSILVLFDFFFLSFLHSKNLGSHSRPNLLSSCPACNKNQLFEHEDDAPSIGSTVINPNVFLLSLELLA